MRVAEPLLLITFDRLRALRRRSFLMIVVLFLLVEILIILQSKNAGHIFTLSGRYILIYLLFSRLS